MFDLEKVNVRWDPVTYVPKKVSGVLSKRLSGSPRVMARAFLHKNSGPLKLRETLGDLHYDKTTESLGAWTVLLQQHYRRIPIHGAWVAVHINRQRRVFMVQNDTIPLERLQEKLGGRRPEFLPADRIREIIEKQVKARGTLCTKIDKERMIYARMGSLRWVWKVKFGTKEPAGSWILFIDRTNGHLIEERDVLRKITGRGQVFLPNPVVALNRDDLRDEGDLDQNAFRKAYRMVRLNDLDPGGCLKGPYVDTTATRRCARSATGSFIYTRHERGFEEVMAYYHIDAAQRYIQSLGFKGKKAILDRPIRVDAHGVEEDNSYYDPSPGRQDLTFGEGGVDDAEDAEVILHEYGHAIQDDIIPGFGQAYEGGAIGEGFGDYWACSFFARKKPKKRRARFGEWDAKGTEGGAQECVRRLDSRKRYPEDMDGEVHDDGEIWSACLWEVRKLLGRRKADTVILESHFYLKQYADFRDGAEAIVMADENLYGGRRGKAVRRVFGGRGIL